MMVLGSVGLTVLVAVDAPPEEGADSIQTS